MIVSDAAKMCFVHIPKTAGSTVAHALGELWPDARQVGGKHDGVRSPAFGQVPEGYFVFGFVRDPFARCRSWWTMLRRVQTNAPGRDRTLFEELACWVVGSAGNFDEFVELLATKVDGEPIHMRRVRASQASYVYDRDQVGRADFVGKTESIGTDLAQALAHAAIAVDLARVGELTADRRNTSGPRRQEEPVGAGTRALIEELYADDYAAFGYPRST